MFISMINFLGIVVNPVTGILRSIGAIFCSFIYWFVVRLFNLFIKIAELDILSSTSIEGMYQRITMILTIVMTFYITFEFIKYVVSPDTITDKEKGAGGLIKRIFVVIVLIAFVPTIFSGAYKLQNRIIETQVFSKIILGQEVFDYSSYGSSFAADALGTFYKVDYDKCGDNCDKAEKEVKDNLEKIRQEGGTIYLADNINICGENVEGTGTLICRPAIDFNGVWGIIFGVFICYVLVMYCIDVGTRYAQLLFLQLISPIAIISYISPKKDGTFQKWIKQCISTYLDLFIRIAIIYFVLVIIRTLGDALKISELTSNGDDVGLLVYAFLVMGLMVFAQKAPKMLQELLPSTGGAASIGYGFGTKERFEPIKKSWQTIKSPYDVSKRAAGAIFSGYHGHKAWKEKIKGNPLYRDRNFNRYKAGKNADAAEKERIAQKNAKYDQRMNKLLRGVTSAYSGMKAVAKGVKTGASKDGNFQKGADAARQSIQKDLDIFESGGDVWGSRFESAKAAETAKEQDRLIARFDEMQKRKKAISTAIEEIKFRKQMDRIGEAITASGDESAAKNWDAVKKAAEKYSRMYADGKISETEFKSKITSEINDYNTKNGQSVTITESDLELDKAAKWADVKTAIDSAKIAAKDIEGQSYTKTNADGTKTEVTITVNDADFAEKVGDISDDARAASNQLKEKPAYKAAHANAKGASGGSNS